MAVLDWVVVWVVAVLAFDVLAVPVAEVLPVAVVEVEAA